MYLEESWSLLTLGKNLEIQQLCTKGLTKQPNSPLTILTIQMDPNAAAIGSAKLCLGRMCLESLH